jgi:hypothetical protein
LWNYANVNLILLKTKEMNITMDKCYGRKKNLNLRHGYLKQEMDCHEDGKKATSKNYKFTKKTTPKTQKVLQIFLQITLRVKKTTHG